MLRFLSSRILFFVLFISYVLIVSCQQKSQYPEPINPNASVQAKALLNFLYEMRGTHILSGLHNGNCSLRVLTSENEVMKTKIGKYPVIWGSDFGGAFRDRNPDSARQNLVNTAMLMHQKGQIITLMWHGCHPAFGDSCGKDNIWVWDNSLPKAEWDSLTTAGTFLNNKWRAQVDKIAYYLKQLRDANIPVLWRPYHEMNGVWFWWCRQPGEEGFVKLWKMMYHYFTDHHQLNNLIWVWNTNAPRDIPKDEAYPYKDYFPGVDYVDVLAADVYRSDWKQSHHDELITLGQGKLIALGEVGHLPTPEVLKQQPQWAWFMEWNTYFQRTPPEQNLPEIIDALFKDPRVLTLDEILLTKEGYYKIKDDLVK